MNRIPVKRHEQRLLPNRRRVLAKPYIPGEEVLLAGTSRAALLLDRILAVPEAEVSALLGQVMASFGLRHREFDEILERHFALVADYLDSSELLSRERRLLIGAYATHEYSPEAAAIFNPSWVPAADQSNLEPSELRFIMSLRAVGEGHLSSIEFRSGVLDGNGTPRLDPAGSYLVAGHRTPPSHYEKSRFMAKLGELSADNDLAQSVLQLLPERFTLLELESSLVSLEQNGPPHAISFETVKMIRVLASSNYVTTFPSNSLLSERIIFPAGPNETRGMEDARFVRFIDEAGAAKYYATYTAYDGFEILPQLIETDDFLSFAISTLHGVAAQNKGMALFPRPIAGRYVMLSRKDRENLHIATSTDVRVWTDVTELYRPQRPWELVQIGNCGSPLETEAGWLVLTHGVGPMRRYAIGALLLDLEDPTKVIGHLAEPLLEPDETEREGYVPNVLYSCGGLIHGQNLVLPYGFSDAGIRFASIPLGELLKALVVID